MSLSIWIAFRYLISRRVGRYAPLLTATAVASVAIGMMALILVMSVMRGFRQELAARLLGFNAHITLKKGADAPPLERADVEGLLAGAKVRDITRFVQGEVIAQAEAAGELIAQGARVRGIEPGELGAMERVEFYFPEGSPGIGALRAQPDGKGPAGTVIGNEIVSQLFVHPDFSDTIDLIAPLAELMPSGDLGPNQLKFEVEGVFRTGVYEYDSKYILVPISDARRLLGLQAEEGWQIRLADAADVARALTAIGKRLPQGWKAQGWHDQNRKLFAALKLERVAMGGVLLMVLLIASFAIIGVVLLVTSAKRKDIAILESMGMTRRGVGRIFLIHAAFIGGLGSALGLAAGLAACLAIDRWPIRLPESYYLDWLPVDLNPPAAIAFAALGVLIAVASAIYPVRQATRLSPIEVLRYE